MNRKGIITTRDIGRNFRAANGGPIPNLGAVELKGKAMNKSRMEVVARVVEVTKPLALVMEMVQADSVLVMNKKRGIIKHMTDAQIKQLKEFLRCMKGCEGPISMEDLEGMWSDAMLRVQPGTRLGSMPYFSPLVSGF